MQITNLGEFTSGWGESVVWDDRSSRLYFADCAARTIHRLDDGETEPHTYEPPSMPTGIVRRRRGRLVGARRTVPRGHGRRGNDACADLAGNVVTGTLNMGPAEGAAWRWSATGGWRA